MWKQGRPVLLLVSVKVSSPRTHALHAAQGIRQSSGSFPATEQVG